MATYIVGWAPDDRLRETAFLAVIGLAASVVTGYLGFASWDDKNVMKHMRPRGPPPEDCPPDPKEE